MDAGDAQLERPMGTQMFGMFPLIYNLRGSPIIHLGFWLSDLMIVVGIHTHYIPFAIIGPLNVDVEWTQFFIFMIFNLY